MALADLVAKAEAALEQHQANAAAVNQSAAALASVVAEFKAEAERVPTIDDLRGLLDRMAAAGAKTA